MATFLICHGAWSAGWAWKKVRPLLRAAGAEVFTPTYTGLGERAHHASPAVDLEMHIEDVLAVIEFEDLRDCVLVGHSYGGMVATGVPTEYPNASGTSFTWTRSCHETGRTYSTCAVRRHGQLHLTGTGLFRQTRRHPIRPRQTSSGSLCAGGRNRSKPSCNRCNCETPRQRTRAAKSTARGRRPTTCSFSSPGASNPIPPGATSKSPPATARTSRRPTR
jgi:Alpha/beta hydrolase family